MSVNKQNNIVTAEEVKKLEDQLMDVEGEPNCHEAIYTC